jgi:hypothetical protein
VESRRAIPLTHYESRVYTLAVSHPAPRALRTLAEFCYGAPLADDAVATARSDKKSCGEAWLDPRMTMVN